MNIKTLTETLSDVLMKCLDDVPPHCVGVRSAALPIEQRPQLCVDALAPLRDYRVVVGLLNGNPATSLETPAHVTLAPAHEAAALATTWRNEADDQRKILYLSSASSPGESGLGEFFELTNERLMTRFANESGLKVLERVASSLARAIRDRLRMQDLSSLWAYAYKVRAAGGGVEAELQHLPMLEFLPPRARADGQDKPPCPDASWVTQWDQLLGVRVANGARDAIRALGSLDERARAELAPLIDASMRPTRRDDATDSVAWLAARARVLRQIANGEFVSAGALPGLTGALVKAVRRGEKIVSWLKKEHEEREDSSTNTRSREEDELDRLSCPIKRYEPKERALTLSLGGEDELTLSAPRGRVDLLQRLGALVANEHWRRGDSMRVVCDATLVGRAPTRRAEVEHIHRLDALTHKPTLGALADARAALIEEARALLDASWDEEAQVLDALTFAARFPLTFITHLDAQARRYVDAYEDALTAAMHDKWSGAALTWLLNHALIYARGENQRTAQAALLGPLHPLRLSRHMIWSSTRTPPPVMPTPLYFNGSNDQLNLDRMVHQDGDLFTRPNDAAPTNKVICDAAKQALKNTWAVLHHHGLTNAIDIELIDLTEVTPALNALAAALNERFDEDADGGALAHLEVYFSSTTSPTPGVVAIIEEELEPLTSAMIGTTPGEGPSLRIHPRILDADAARLRTIKIAASRARYTPLNVEHTATAALRIHYEVGPDGQVVSARATGDEMYAFDAHAALLREHGWTQGVGIGADEQTAPLGALFELSVSRGGWPVSPGGELIERLLYYDQVDDHFTFMTVDAQISRALLQARFSNSTLPRLPERARDNALMLYDARALFSKVLDLSVDDGALRGDLGKLRAFDALLRDREDRLLILNLDGPQGLAWNRLLSQHCGVSQGRADLLIVEVGDQEDIKLVAVELKSFESEKPSYVPYLAQAQQARARLLRTFEEDAPARVREALRALWWLGAGYMRRAGTWNASLRKLDELLEASQAPRVESQLWVTIGRGDGDLESRAYHVRARDIDGAPGEDEEEAYVYVLNVADAAVDSVAAPPRGQAPARAAEVKVAALPSDDHEVAAADDIADPRGRVDLEKRYQDILAMFREYGVTVQAAADAERYREGPGFYVVRLLPGRGQRANSLQKYTPELKLRLGLAQEQEPLTYIDKGSVVFEIPKPDEERYFVEVTSLLRRFEASPTRLSVPIGEDINGAPITLDFSSSDSPHLLIGGTTGSGKSVALESILYGLCELKRPDELELVLVDPKGTELSAFERRPHVRGVIGFDAEDAIEALTQAVDEMQARLQRFKHARVRSLPDYNQRVDASQRLPWRVIVLDEYADLTSAPEEKKELEALLQRIAQKARSTGIHLIVATQKPSAAVLSTSVRSNLPAQLALRVKTSSDSRIILDDTGAEALAGKGDAFFKTTRGMVRVQCAYVDA